MHDERFEGPVSTGKVPLAGLGTLESRASLFSGLTSAAILPPTSRKPKHFNDFDTCRGGIAGVGATNESPRIKPFPPPPPTATTGNTAEIVTKFGTGFRGLLPPGATK